MLPIRSLVVAFLVTMLSLLAIDAFWLGVLMGPTYQGYIGHLMLAEPRLAPAALFYLLYPAGLMVFAVLPALRHGRVSRALQLGALFGLVAYGTYDLSNLATLRGWPWQLTLIDMLWGSFLSSLATASAYLAARRDFR